MLKTAVVVAAVAPVLFSVIPVAQAETATVCVEDVCGQARQGWLEEPLWVAGIWAQGTGACLRGEPPVPELSEGGCRPLNDALGALPAEAEGRRIVWAMAVEARELLEVCAAGGCPAGFLTMIPALEQIAGDPGLSLDAGALIGPDGAGWTVRYTGSGQAATLICSREPAQEARCSLEVRGASGWLRYSGTGEPAVAQIRGESGVLRYWEELEPKWLLVQR